MPPRPPAAVWRCRSLPGRYAPGIPHLGKPLFLSCRSGYILRL